MFALSAFAPVHTGSTMTYHAGVFETTYSVPFTMKFSESDFVFDKIIGYDLVSLIDGDYLTTIGKPMLPMQTIRIALPGDMQATNIRINKIKEQTLPGTYTIFPAQHPKPIGSQKDDKPFVIDSYAYQSDTPYPSNYAELIGQTDLAGQPIAVINIYPLHYLANQHRLFLLDSIEFIIEGTSGYQCGDYLSPHASESTKQLYQQLVGEMVANPDEVILHSGNNPQTTGVGPGNYDYVIITQSSWVNNFQPLADWKTKKGVKATIVTTTWIYNSGGYSGTNQQKIRSFIQDAYTNWGATFFLLGGDTDIIPYQTVSYLGDTIPADTYYADFDSDWVCEAHVGRAPVTTTSQISTFINKILTYEKNPPLSNYAKIAFFMGFDLYASGSGEGQNCKEYIKNQYLSGWTYRKVYDTDSGNHYSNVINNLNLGNNLVNHIDHSDTAFMGTGYTNHGWGLTNSDMNSLTNGNRQSILYTIGCWACDYPASCIGEAFVQNTNGGGVAFIGNSRYGWYQPYTSDGYSLRFDRYFFRSLLNQNNYKLGVCFSDHKNDAYQNNNYYKYIFSELTLLGDPEMPIWTNNPSSLTATHPSQLPAGSSQFKVRVTSSGNPVNQAYVCLWKGNEVYLTGYTNTAGDVTFNPSPTTTGTLYVTVTKQNYLPYESQATVVSQNQPPSIPAQPIGPIKGIEQTEYIYGTQTNDPDNDHVYYLWDWGNEMGTWFGPYPSGVMMYVQHSWPSYGIYSVKVKAKDEQNMESEWSTPLQVRIYRVGDTNADNKVDFGDINPFVIALSSGETAYYQKYPDGYYYTADINQDGQVDFGDINPFVSLLSGG